MSESADEAREDLKDASKGTFDITWLIKLLVRWLYGDKGRRIYRRIGRKHSGR